MKNGGKKTLQGYESESEGKKYVVMCVSSL